jgi:hypothetical protein
MKLYRSPGVWEVTMSPTQRDRDPTPWGRLGKTLSGYFAARARGLLASDFALLDRDAREFGLLEVHGPQGAELRFTGGLEAEIERVTPTRHRMFFGDAEVLTSTGAATSPKIRCLGVPYQTTLSLLRNSAEASPANALATVRIKGGLTNRCYEVFFEPDKSSPLPVALFLLYHIVTLRREAYRAATGFEHQV